jgi:hypothetical protein
VSKACLQEVFFATSYEIGTPSESRAEFQRHKPTLIRIPIRYPPTGGRPYQLFASAHPARAPKGLNQRIRPESYSKPAPKKRNTENPIKQRICDANPIKRPAVQ